MRLIGANHDEQLGVGEKAIQLLCLCHLKAQSATPHQSPIHVSYHVLLVTHVSAANASRLERGSKRGQNRGRESARQADRDAISIARRL